ncbi:MAG: gamma-glutamyl-gamma-aminobutyrate hydrolase family protein [Oligoflexia bacterium]|nr:gamma-glutamyl-gamma-aminobutyrate hydrolase family protein [Oligoflexia bacterium]
MKPRIAISLRSVTTEAYSEVRDAISRDWVELLSDLNVLPIFIPNGINTPAELMDATGISGVILSNGNDVGADPVRDQTERAMVEYAIKKNLPVVGICRGLQFLNVYFGGSLIKSIKAQSPDEKHTGANHLVRIVDHKASKVFKLDEFQVNSYHDQGLTEKELASELIAFAKSPEGIVEGAYHSKFPIYGVQWHPERKGPSAGQDKAMLIDWLKLGQGVLK